MYLNSILSSHGASFHPGVEMGTSELLGKPDEILGCVLGFHPGRGGGVEGMTTPLVASCYRGYSTVYLLLCCSDDRSRFLRFVTGRRRLPAPLYICPGRRWEVTLTVFETFFRFLLWPTEYPTFHSRKLSIYKATLCGVLGHINELSGKPDLTLCDNLLWTCIDLLQAEKYSS